jgi:hypothetical protein
MRDADKIFPTQEHHFHRFRRTLDALGLRDILVERMDSLLQGIRRGKLVQENIVTMMGRCPICYGPVPVPYYQTKMSTGDFRCTMIGTYPIHRGECEYLFELLKKRRSGAAA